MSTKPDQVHSGDVTGNNRITNHVARADFNSSLTVWPFRALNTYVLRASPVTEPESMVPRPPASTVTRVLAGALFTCTADELADVP
jgi:hypothetical protein